MFLSRRILIWQKQLLQYFGPLPGYYFFLGLPRPILTGILTPVSFISFSSLQSFAKLLDSLLLDKLNIRSCAFSSGTFSAFLCILQIFGLPSYCVLTRDSRSTLFDCRPACGMPQDFRSRQAQYRQQKRGQNPMNPQNNLLNIRLPRLLKFHLPKSLDIAAGALPIRRNRSEPA